MSRKKEKQGGASVHHSLSVRNRLMIFLCLISVVQLLAVGILLIYFLQPRYNQYIHDHLQRQLDTMVQLINDNPQDISRRGLMGLEVDPEFWLAVSEAAQNGSLDVSNCCVEICDKTLGRVYNIENLYPCLLHKVDRSVTGRVNSQDTPDALRLRAELFQNGSLYRILTTSSDSLQMVVGSTARDGRYAVIVSANLARVSEARRVLEQYLPVLILISLAVSTLAAWLFSRWLTRPLSSLSKAAQQVAQGNYNVQMPISSDDEIGLLTMDFNRMADEVGRTIQGQRELFANVSHDLRTPLTLIKGYAETVRDLTGNDEAKRTDQLNVIVDETDRLSGLVNNMLELSRVNSGAEAPQPEAFDMAQLCAEVAQRYTGVCAQNGWTLTLEAPEPCPVVADPRMMERVLHNLLGNAMHHLGPDGIFLLRAKPTPEGIRVEVEDHGPGIPPEELPQLFQRYYRSRGNEGKVGTGLGLAITKALLQSHGYRFGVQSTVGKGSLFWFVMSPPPETH